jgi:hypothetical protein
MNINNLLSRLEKVKQTGNDRWLACCPAHHDKQPSMNIKENPDGTILIICRTGCASHDILQAIGMEFSDLFPEKLADHIRPQRKPFPAADVLEALSTETLIVHITADRISKGLGISPDDLDRLKLASGRIQAGRDLANG